MRQLSGTFSRIVRPVFHVVAPPAESAHGARDALGFAALAVLLLVITAALLVRTSAQLLGRERPV